jgi:ATP-dependent RNA helicase RhlE
LNDLRAFFKMYNKRFNRSSGSRFGRRSYGGNNRFNNRREPQGLNPMMFVRRAADLPEQEEYVPTHAFSDFDMHEQLKKNVKARQYVNPTPIQDQTIPALLEGQDVVGIANTGTGKTAAFLIPLIHKVATNRNSKVLIVAPTRELAVQIRDELKEFSYGMNISSVLCIGGVGMYNQIEMLKRNPDFVIGTPGRLMDLERRNKVRFGSFNSIVLDEVDRMLDMGFVHDITDIINKLPEDRQSLFFSATMPDGVRRLMQGFLRNPVTVTIKSQPTSANVDQDIIRINGRGKVDVLHDLLGQDGFNKVLIFGRTKHGIERLADALYDRGFHVASIHGNKNQGQRQRALSAFKENKIQVLLATDVAARGLDIDNVTHVINYDPPTSYEDYIHRIGRTGRADKKGVALTFVD